MDDRERLRQQFDRSFAGLDIELPTDAMSPGKVGMIVQRGWTIWIRVDLDAEAGREYLDYYAVHRMTSDQHVRIYADGETKGLSAMIDWYSIPKGATETEKKAARERYYAHNQAVEKELEEKGFVMTSKAHGSAILNRRFKTRPDAWSQLRPGEDAT